MESKLEMSDADLRNAVNSAVSDLVSVEAIGRSQFVRLPLFFPDGSHSTVRVERTQEGIRVTDNGFAYRELETIGAERSFGHVAKSVCEEERIDRDERAIFVVVDAHDVQRAICDVGAASWRIVERVHSKIVDEEFTDEDFEEVVRDRIVGVFGAKSIRKEKEISGASASSWSVSALIDHGEGLAVFQAVNDHTNSIYRTSTAFSDLVRLDRPPRLVAVVPKKAMLGSKLSLLSQSGGRVIEAAQPNEQYELAVA